jgi:hypothetical protein
LNILNQESIEDEYGAKQKKKIKHSNIDKSKYFQSNSKEVISRKRRCLSEETSRNNSVNLSTQKVILNQHKRMSRDSSLESVHTFHLKRNSVEKKLKKSKSNVSMFSDKFGKNLKDTLVSDSDGNSQCIYVEERVKFLKNTQLTCIYNSLKEV